mgnify:FL=1
MTRRALHMLAPNLPGDASDARRALCGETDRKYRRVDMTPDSALVLAENLADRGCERCRKKLREAVAARALRSLGIAPAAHAQKQAPLSRALHAIIGRSIRGETEDGPRWSSAHRALEHEARVVLDGAPVRSSSDTERFGILPQQSKGEAPVPAAIAGREDVIAVRVSIDRACRACADAVAIGTIGCGAAFDAADFELVLRWLTQGEPVWQQTAPARKGRVQMLRQRDALEVAGELTLRRGHAVTERQVAIAYRAVLAAFSETLRATGELRAARPKAEREAKMAAPEGWVETWESIAKVVGRSVDTCQRLAKREENPLPVGEYLSRAAAKVEELEAWKRREVERSRAA